MLHSISSVLEPHKDLIGQVASIVTILQFFSGVFICNDIRKQQTTCGISSTPFIGGIVMGLSTFRYGQILDDNAILIVNLIAVLLNVLYSIFYYVYSPAKWEEIVKPLSVGVVIIAILCGYSSWENRYLIEYRFGVIITVMMLLFMGAPLLGVKEIIRQKDASSIPFVLAFMGAVVTFLWLLYAITIHNDFMIFQNIVGFVLCFVQVILIFLYPGPSRKFEGAKKLE